MLKLSKFNKCISLWTFEVRAEEPFINNTVKIEEKETEKLWGGCTFITGFSPVPLKREEFCTV